MIMEKLACFLCRAGVSRISSVCSFVLHMLQPPSAPGFYSPAGSCRVNAQQQEEEQEVGAGPQLL